MVQIPLKELSPRLTPEAVVSEVCKELGMYFGNVSGTTITMACNRVEKEIT